MVVRKDDLSVEETAAVKVQIWAEEMDRERENKKAAWTGERLAAVKVDVKVRQLVAM